MAQTNWRRINGTACVIISPTRELALQTYSTARELMTEHATLTHGIIMGGAKRDKEADAL